MQLAIYTENRKLSKAFQRRVIEKMGCYGTVLRKRLTLVRNNEDNRFF